MLLAQPSVPYYDFARRAAPDRAAVKTLLADVASSGEFILKRRVAALEQQLCAFTGARHVVAVSSGTAAIHLALAALDTGPGDEVITPAFSFHSSASPILHLGARAVFADVDEDTLTLDVESAERVATSRTRGILPVHLFSAMADMPALHGLSRERGWWIMEDSAVALGMSWHGVAAGRWGDLGVLSFHPAKPLAGTSDGGAIVTDCAALACRARMLRNHGQDGVNRFLHHLVGFNARMDEVNAGVLSRRLERFPADLARRAEIAARYDAAFADCELRTPPAVRHERTYYTYVVRSRRRDALERHLAAKGVESVVYYPRPLHLQPAFGALGYREGAFPNAERASRQALALPLHPRMTGAEVERVVEAVREFDGR